MINKTLFFLILFFSITTFSQQNIISLESYSEDKFIADDFVGFDNFGSLFYINSNVLFKKNNTAKYQYQNLQLGKISRVDILNPLKTLVFYEEFNTVVLLDNFLNEIQKINFSEIESPIVISSAGICGQNKIWVYNVTNQQIAIFDLINATTQNLNIPIKEKQFYYQTDYNNYYWQEQNGNLQYCTVFGKVFSKGNFDGFILQVTDEYVFYKKESQVFIYSFKNDEVYEIVNIENSFKKIFYKEQILSIFTNQGITNYKITIP